MPKYVAGIGPFHPKLMIIGEAPGSLENATGVPFVGPSGELLDKFLHKAGISRAECYITNVVKYQPPFNDLQRLHLISDDNGNPITIQESTERLWSEEIRVLKPNAILAVGDLALKATTGLTGILNYRGSILRSRDGDYKVIPTVHPAALFKRVEWDDEKQEAKGGLPFVYSKLIQHDINRAVEESANSQFNLPDRTLSIARDSLDVYRFFQEYKSLDKVDCDIESINCVPVCVGFAFSPHHAISIPLLKQINNIELTGMSYSSLVECWRLIDENLRRLWIIGHNYKYDDFKLGLIGFRTANVYSDTLLKTRVLFPELPDKRLSTVSSLWTREPYYKEEGKEFQFGKSPIEQLFKYNAKDCAVGFEVDQEQEETLLEMQDTYHVPLHDYYYNYMMKKHKVYLKMENNGFRIDYERQKELRVRYEHLEAEAHAKLIQLVGHEVNVKSTPQKFFLFYKELRFPERKKQPTSEDTIVSLIAKCKSDTNGRKKKEILETVLEESRIRDQKSRNINFIPDFDKRCKTAFNISATETCRSSTSVLKRPLRPSKIGLAFHTISKHGRLAKDIRSMFIPDEGKIFIQADSSQAEARVVAVLSEDYELLEAFDRIDIHRRTAGLILGMTKELILSTEFIPKVDEIGKDAPERFCGKKTRHAGNYDMKERRFTTEFNTDAQKFGIKMGVSEWKSKQMLDLFHSASPKIRGVFHSDIRDCIDSTRCLIDPFGGVRIFNGRFDEDLYKEGYANIPQRTVAHLVQGALIKISEELGNDDSVMFISENHDSLLLQAPASNWEPYARLMKKHMQAEIDFSLYCSLKRNVKLTIPCDIEVSDTNYAEMRKVKV